MADQVPDAAAQSPSISERIHRVMDLALVDLSDQDINGMSIDEIRTLCTSNDIIPGQKGITTLRQKLLALRADLQERRRQMPTQMPNPTQQDSTSPHQDRRPSLSSHEADPPPDDEDEAVESSSNGNNAARLSKSLRRLAKMTKMMF
jgi:DNA-binding transcriptional MerR regulator